MTCNNSDHLHNGWHTAIIDDHQYDECTTEEDLRFKKYLDLMEERGNMRIALNQMVKTFNQWNEREFPGQFLPVYLAVEDRYGLRKITT